MSSMAAPAISPVPRLIAFIIVSLGMLSALASSIALRKRAFPAGSPPPRAATVSSLISLENILPRLASMAPFLCLIECHLECPDMITCLRRLRACVDYQSMPIENRPRRLELEVGCLLYDCRDMNQFPRLGSIR